MLKYDAKLLGFKYTNITGGHFNIGSRKLRGFKKKIFSTYKFEVMQYGSSRVILAVQFGIDYVYSRGKTEKQLNIPFYSWISEQVYVQLKLCAYHIKALLVSKNLFSIIQSRFKKTITFQESNRILRNQSLLKVNRLHVLVSPVSLDGNICQL